MSAGDVVAATGHLNQSKRSVATTHEDNIKILGFQNANYTNQVFIDPVLESARRNAKGSSSVKGAKQSNEALKQPRKAQSQDRLGSSQQPAF